MNGLQVAMMRARSCSYPVKMKELPAPEITPETPPILFEPPKPKPRSIDRRLEKLKSQAEIYKAPVGDIAKIQHAVADYYKWPMADLLSKRRATDIVTARHVAIWLAKTMTLRSYPEIGRSFRQDHTSALHAVRRITERMKSDVLLAAQVADLQARLTPVQNAPIV